MDPQQQFCLKWNSFGSNLVTAFDHLFKSESLTDVTLFCEGVTFKAHKLILAACSKHFQELFEAAAPLNHAGGGGVLVILDGTSSSNMSALLEFMYKGEVHVSHDSLSSFLKAAECLQVKGLSIEPEKLAVAHTHVTPLDPQQQQQQQQQQQMDSPNSSSSNSTRTNNSLTNSSHKSLPPLKTTCTMLPLKDDSGGGAGEAGGGGGGGGGEMQPPSTSSASSYTPILSPYMHQYMAAAAYETSTVTSVASNTPPSPYEPHPRKRAHLRSPAASDSASVRASVLRDGSKQQPPPSSDYNRPPSTTPPTMNSGGGGAGDYTPRQSPPNAASRYMDGGGSGGCVDGAGQTAAAAITAVVTSFDRTVAVDDTPQDHMWQQASACPEDLRIKSEPSSDRDRERERDHDRERERERENRRERERMKKSEWTPGPGPGPGGGYGGITEGAPLPDNTATTTPDITMWNSGTTSTKIAPTYKSGQTTTTPDGKKLQCPFCERLYGYETNLRAHIRQRHQGIRVPCPFCSRTFTRNNTVRRHIQREHKNELSLKALQQQGPAAFVAAATHATAATHAAGDAALHNHSGQ